MAASASHISSATLCPMGVEQPAPRLRLVHEAGDPCAVVEQWAHWMQARGMAARTVSERVRFIRYLAATTGQEPVGFTTEAIGGYLATVRERSTRCTYYAAVKAFCDWMIRVGHRRDDPMIGIGAPMPPRRQPHPIATAHLEALLASHVHRRTRAMVLLGAYQGLRVHEIAKVRGEDVDRIGGTLRVQGKGSRVDHLPLHEIIAVLAEDFPARGWWFPAYNDPARHVLGNSVSTVLSQAMRRVNVPGTGHSLRHWYGTELVRSGADLRTVQMLMRHASLATTQIYTLIADEQRSAAIARLPVAVGSA